MDLTIPLLFFIYGVILFIDYIRTNGDPFTNKKKDGK